MKKYWIVHLSFMVLFLTASHLFWETPYSFTIQFVGLLAAAAIAVIMQLIIRDKLLREVEADDPEAYQRLLNISKYAKVNELNIEKDYPYHEKTQELIDWWTDYGWITFATVAIPFILLVYSGIFR